MLQNVYAETEMCIRDRARNPGNFDQKFYYEKQGLHASIWVKNCRITDQETWKFREWLAKLRRNWKRLLVSQMGARHGNSMSAILLGEKSELDAQMKALYQKSGIGHILAISGLHMSFIGMGFYGLLRRVGYVSYTHLYFRWADPALSASGILYKQRNRYGNFT